MPIVSTFFGIVIRMYYREHGVPHFHAEYQGEKATFTFDGMSSPDAFGREPQYGSTIDPRMVPWTSGRIGGKLAEGEER